MSSVVVQMRPENKEGPPEEPRARAAYWAKQYEQAAVRCAKRAPQEPTRTMLQLLRMAGVLAGRALEFQREARA